ncbi:hypothetical protein CRM22_007599 [Opisthorchis felineus]|uniref:G-protein coupled receptors family 1 profile domain-containing protein n=1 Tax=Opisthorchis felineus TaxID=147828 RepID=A0A4S2LNH1_OPIFE|nr:hypothetical protein CRM22_007599 [Opisthorchis felineus]
MSLNDLTKCSYSKALECTVFEFQSAMTGNHFRTTIKKWTLRSIVIFTFLKSLRAVETNITQNTTSLYQDNHTKLPDYGSRVIVPSTPPEICKITLTEFILYFCCQPVICLCGFFLNVLSVTIFCKPQFSGAAYTYMTAMSLTDAITLLIHIPAGLVRCSGYFPYCQQTVFKQFRMGMLYYNAYVLFPLDNMSECASVWLTVLLAIERYMAMSKLRFRSTGFTANGTSQSTENITRKHGPLCLNCGSAFTKCRSRFRSTIRLANPRRTLLSRINCSHSIILVTTLSVVLHVPYFFVQIVQALPSRSVNPTTSNNYTGPPTKLTIQLTEFGHSDVYKALSWIRVVLVQGIPLAFLCVANFCLFHYIQLATVRRQQVLLALPQTQQNRKRKGKFNAHKQSCRTTSSSNGGSASRWHTAQRKLTSLLIVIVALFLAGQIPQAFAYVAVFEMFGSDCTRWSCCQPYQIYRAITTTLRLTTYAVNFFVYLLLNKHFKHQLRIWVLSQCTPCVSSNSLAAPSTTAMISNVPKSHLLLRGPRLALSAIDERAETSKWRKHLCVQDIPSEARSLPLSLEYKQDTPVLQYLHSVSISKNQELFSSTSQDLRVSVDIPVTKTNDIVLDKTKLMNNPTGYCPTYCSCTLESHKQTEILFGNHYVPSVSKSFQTYFSYDTVTKKVTIDRHHHDPTQSTHGERLSNEMDLHVVQPCFNPCSPLGKQTHFSTNSVRAKMYLPQPTNLPSSTLLLEKTENQCDMKNLVQVNKSLRSTDSSYSLYHLVSSLVYEESDFDVISVDDSADPEIFVTNTAV